MSERAVINKDHRELARYLAAGASGAALFTFPQSVLMTDGFLETNLMQGQAGAVLIEGDSPLILSDLTCFVAPPLKDPQQPLLLRREPGRASAKAKTRPKRWAIASGYEGIERQRLVVVNIRNESERQRGEALAAQVAGLRKDPEVYKELVGMRDTRPVTVAVANLRDPKDAGLKEALARVHQAFSSVASRPPR